MSRLFIRARIDPRRLTTEAHRIPQQTPGARRAMYGKIRVGPELLPPHSRAERLGRAIAGFSIGTGVLTILYFAAQLLRGWQ